MEWETLRSWMTVVMYLSDRRTLPRILFYEQEGRLSANKKKSIGRVKEKSIFLMEGKYAKGNWILPAHDTRKKYVWPDCVLAMEKGNDNVRQSEKGSGY